MNRVLKFILRPFVRRTLKFILRPAERVIDTVAPRAADRRLTPCEVQIVTAEEMWRDLTPAPEPYVSPDMRPLADLFSADFAEQPTARIER